MLLLSRKDAMRVGILALLQESNTFTPGVTTRADFAADLLLQGEAIRERLQGTHHEVDGFFAGLADANIDAVPIFAARAVPWGPIAASDYASLLNELLASLTSAGPLDGVLVAAHGATVSERIHDVDGDWLSAVRRQIGPDTPLIGTLDPHANLSPRMVASCDALIAYQTNPHLDQRDRGMEAARLMSRTLRGEVRPRMAAAFPPLAINIECQHTGESPCREWFDKVADYRSQRGVLAASALLGFPYADVAEMGASAIVVADNDVKRAQRIANELAQWAWQRREQFRREMTSVSTAVKRIADATGPVCLLDTGDNIGGGGPADGTYLAQSLREAGVGPSLVCLYDPAVVKRAQQIGVGGEFSENVGGKSCPLSGRQLAGSWKVLGLFSGKFSETRPRHGGFSEFDQGPTAVLSDGAHLTVITTSRRTPPYSLEQITSCGLDPTTFRVIVAKGVHAPVAAYGEVCSELIRVDTLGVTSADLARLEYQRRRRPLFPLEQEGHWMPERLCEEETLPWLHEEHGALS